MVLQGRVCVPRSNVEGTPPPQKRGESFRKGEQCCKGVLDWKSGVHACCVTLDTQGPESQPIRRGALEHWFPSLADPQNSWGTCRVNEHSRWVGV